MFSLLHLLSYVGGLTAFLFVTLSLASGLLWLAELIEEHSKYAKIVGMRAIYTIITLHLLLIFTDSLPFLPTLFSIFCHLVYLQNFTSSWPFISLTSPRFVLSCILVVADHFTWFFHFAARAQEAKRYRGPRHRYGGGTVGGGGPGAAEAPSFMDVAAFFAICVWAVPLFLFLSLSANDNAMPSYSAGPMSPSVQNSGSTSAAVDLSSPGPGAMPASSHRLDRQRTSTSLVKSLLVPLVSLLPRLRGARPGRRQHDEGIIAPRTPVRGSPLHSPVNMQQSYFPWNGDDATSTSTPTASSSFSSTGAGGISAPVPPSGLTPEAAKLLGRGKNPGPPRRVQSELSVSKGASTVNPRGIATRNGRPAVPDSMLAEDDAGTISDDAAGSKGSRDAGSPAMSLGPRGLEALGRGREVVERERDASKRKAD